jgi:hypothetical protein
MKNMGFSPCVGVALPPRCSSTARSARNRSSTPLQTTQRRHHARDHEKSKLSSMEGVKYSKSGAPFTAQVIQNASVEKRFELLFHTFMSP